MLGDSESESGRKATATYVDVGLGSPSGYVDHPPHNAGSAERVKQGHFEMRDNLTYEVGGGRDEIGSSSERLGSTNGALHGGASLRTRWEAEDE